MGPADKFSTHISQSLFTFYLYCKVAEQSDNAKTPRVLKQLKGAYINPTCQPSQEPKSIRKDQHTQIHPNIFNFTCILPQLLIGRSSRMCAVAAGDAELELHLADALLLTSASSLSPLHPPTSTALTVIESRLTTLCHCKTGPYSGCFNLSRQTVQPHPITNITEVIFYLFFPESGWQLFSSAR